MRSSRVENCKGTPRAFSLQAVGLPLNEGHGRAHWVPTFARGVELRLAEPVDLCGQDEIAFRQTVDFVRPARDRDFSPGQRDIWVVTLLLREFAYAVYEFQSFAKVGKREGLRDVVFFDDVPAVHLRLQDGELFPLERRDASSARDACFGR